MDTIQVSYIKCTGDSSMNPDLGQEPLLYNCRYVLPSLECCLERQHPLFITPCDRKQEYAHSWFPRMRRDDSKHLKATPKPTRRSKYAPWQTWRRSEWQESYWNYVWFHSLYVISIIQNTTQQYELYTSKWSVWLIEYTDVIKNLFTHLHKYTLREQV